MFPSPLIATSQFRIAKIGVWISNMAAHGGHIEIFQVNSPKL